MKSESEDAQLCPTLCSPMDCSLPGNFPGKNTGVGCHLKGGNKQQGGKTAPSINRKLN